MLGEQVERITQKRTRNGRHEYLVKWVGKPESQATWEPLTQLMGSIDLINEFEKREPKAIPGFPRPFANRPIKLQALSGTDRQVRSGPNPQPQFERKHKSHSSARSAAIARLPAHWEVSSSSNESVEGDDVNTADHILNSNPDRSRSTAGKGQIPRGAANGSSSPTGEAHNARNRSENKQEVKRTGRQQRGEKRTQPETAQTLDFPRNSTGEGREVRRFATSLQNERLDSFTTQDVNAAGSMRNMLGSNADAMRDADRDVELNSMNTRQRSRQLNATATSHVQQRALRSEDLDQMGGEEEAAEKETRDKEEGTEKAIFKVIGGRGGKQANDLQARVAERTRAGLLDEKSMKTQPHTRDGIGHHNAGQGRDAISNSDNGERSNRMYARTTTNKGDIFARPKLNNNVAVGTTRGMKSRATIAETKLAVNNEREPREHHRKQDHNSDDTDGNETLYTAEIGRHHKLNNKREVRSRHQEANTAEDARHSYNNVQAADKAAGLKGREPTRTARETGQGGRFSPGAQQEARPRRRRALSLEDKKEDEDKDKDKDELVRKGRNAQTTRVEELPNSQEMLEYEKEKLSLEREKLAIERERLALETLRLEQERSKLALQQAQCSSTRRPPRNSNGSGNGNDKGKCYGYGYGYEYEYEYENHDGFAGRGEEEQVGTEAELLSYGQSSLKQQQDSKGMAMHVRWADEVPDVKTQASSLKVVATRVVGVRPGVGGKLEYAIEVAKEDSSTLISCLDSNELKQYYPSLMIDYLERHILFKEEFVAPSAPAVSLPSPGT